MIIKNGLVFEESGSFVKKDLYVDDSHKIIETPMENDAEVIDAEGLYVIPGLVDIHVHGAVGYDFCDGSVEGLAAMATYYKSKGVTSFCPTSMTLPIPELEKIFNTITQLPEKKEYARVAGIHMEGPFIAEAKKGAQKASYISAPSVEYFHTLNEACNGQIKVITMAPEEEGAMEFIKAVHDITTISLGHTTANYDIANEAYQAGAQNATHLFNAMPPFHHRDPGVIGAAADNEHAMVEMICDGIHLHGSVIRTAFKIFGDNRVIFVSDSMRACGMEDGVYELGGQDVYKNGNRATLKDGTLAGSATNLYDCMKTAVSFGIPLESAVNASTMNPAKSIGLTEVGILAIGKEADVLLVDKDLNLIKVI